MSMVDISTLNSKLCSDDPFLEELELQDSPKHICLMGWTRCLGFGESLVAG